MTVGVSGGQIYTLTTQEQNARGRTLRLGAAAPIPQRKQGCEAQKNRGCGIAPCRGTPVHNGVGGESIPKGAEVQTANGIDSGVGAVNPLICEGMASSRGR